MIIGIIAAMDEELEPLLKDIKLERKEAKAKMEFYLGSLYGKEVVLVRSGIGKVNAAICAQVLIDDFSVDKMINVGVAGGVEEHIFPGDVVIADNLVQHDVDTTVFGDRVGQVPRLETYDFKCDKDMINKAKGACENIEEHKSFIGRIITGDQFVADLSKIQWLRSEFNALACEMEGGSIAQVCYLNEIPFVVIRSISDNAQNGAHMDYEKFKLIAVKNSVNILKGMLNAM